MTKTKKRRVFPFTAVIGQEEMKMALILNVIDPRIGGVMIMGDRGTGKPALDIEEALLLLKEQIEIANDLLFPIEWEDFREKEKAFQLIPNCLEKILSAENGKQRFCDTVLKITQAFSLCSSTNETKY